MPDYDAWARSIDPDEKDRWQFRMSLAVEQFMARQISDDVFRACLYGLGLRGAILAAEFDYHQANRKG